MTQQELNKKLLVIVGCLPVIRDFVEDVQETKIFRQSLKKALNDVIKESDKMLFHISDGIEQNEAYQQNNIELAFRQWIDKNFKDESHK